jgi:hypothetical protein
LPNPAVHDKQKKVAIAQRKPTPPRVEANDEIPLDEVTATFVPKTELGRRLRALRAEIVHSGIPMLRDEDLDREIAERRGGTALWEYKERHGIR